MKKLAALSFLLAAVAVNATTFTYKPNDGQGDTDDVFDLDHHYAYSWGINAGSLKTELQNGATITSAKVKITSIWDWIVEPNDRLWVNLLDDPAAGLKAYEDNENDIESTNPASNYFNNKGTAIGYWTDPNGGDSNQAINLTFTFTSAQITALVSYILDATSAADFGFGFDPDCHYYNTGVSFEVTTTPRVPEGGLTVAMLGLALSGLALASRKLGRR